MITDITKTILTIVITMVFTLIMTTFVNDKQYQYMIDVIEYQDNIIHCFDNVINNVIDDDYFLDIISETDEWQQLDSLRVLDYKHIEW